MKRLMRIICITIMILFVTVLPAFAFPTLNLPEPSGCPYWVILQYTNAEGFSEGETTGSNWKLIQTRQKLVVGGSQATADFTLSHPTDRWGRQSSRNGGYVAGTPATYTAWVEGPTNADGGWFSGSYGRWSVYEANYALGAYSPVSLSLSIVPDYYVYNVSELTNAPNIITVNQTGIDKTKQISCTITNPQGVQKTTFHNWQFNNSMISLWDLNPLTSYWTTGNYNLTVSCDGKTDTGLFGLQTSNSPTPGVVIDSGGTSYNVEAVKQAYYLEPRQNQNKDARFSTIIKTNSQPYRLPNGKSTYSIYYYMQGNKSVNGTINSDVLMLSGEERYWYSSETVGLKDFVLYVGENPTSSAYSGSVGVSARTDISTWQHPIDGKWYHLIDLVTVNYGRAPTISEELNGPVSPYQVPGQTAWEAIVNTTQSGISYTMPGVTFDFDSVTSSIVEYMSGFAQFFSIIGSLFSFIPQEIMGLGIVGATMSLALMIFRR